MADKIEAARTAYGVAIAKRQKAEKVLTDADDAHCWAMRDEESALAAYRKALEEPLNVAIKAAGGTVAGDDEED